MIPNGGIVPPLGPPPRGCGACAGPEVRLVPIGGALGPARAMSAIDIADPGAERAIAEARSVLYRVGRAMPDPSGLLRAHASPILPPMRGLAPPPRGGPHAV